MDESDPRQGDHLPAVRHLWRVGADGEPEELETPLGVVLLTQCCDLAREGVGDPVAAAVVELNGTEERNARSGRMPRYAPADDIGAGCFVDFGTTGSLSHSFVVAAARRAMTTSAERVILGSRIARKFSRFAYPDEVQPFLQRLRSRIREKARSEASPLGQCLRRVQTIRVENEFGWDTSSPWTLNIVFVLQEGALPTLELTEPAIEDSPSPSIADIAGRLATSDFAHPTAGSLWRLLGEALVQDALQAGGEVVLDATSEVLEESEFTYYRFRRSADLDIDDLSETEADG